MYKYDEDLIKYIDNLGIFNLKNYDFARQCIAEMASKRVPPSLDGLKVEDLIINGSKSEDVLIRIYRKAGNDSKLPVILTIHGGGFVLGNINTDHKLSVDLVNRLDACVVSVDYSLSPEAVYPKALHDCYTALEWIYENAIQYNFDREKIIVHGISAGGGLAAALSLLSRDMKGPQIYHQYLDLPEIDDRLDTPSMKMFHDTPGWNTPNAKLSWQYYLGDGADRSSVDYYAAPARAEDLTNLPSATICAYEYDPLRSEAIQYSERLFDAGVSTELIVYSGAYHLAYLFEETYIGTRHRNDKYSILDRVISR